MTASDVRHRVAGRFSSRFLRGYVASKIGSDPVYAAVLERLRGHDEPLLDVGCGVGVLSFFLREHGLTMPIDGIDHDAKKIAAARAIAPHYDRLTFAAADARSALRGFHGSVLMLDLLHYFRDDEQQQLLRDAAAATLPGGVVIVRDAVRDRSWRYRITQAQETFSRAVRWLKAERLNFPTIEAVAAPFRAAGFSEEIVPLWGRTPFNNYLFVFTRPATARRRE